MSNNLVSVDGVFHAILGNGQPTVANPRETVQRVCDQRLVSNADFFGDGDPTCLLCKRVVEEREKLMAHLRRGVGGLSNGYEVAPPPPDSGEEGLSTFLNVLSINVRAWSQHNFGDNPSHRQVLGMIEEVCELKEAVDIMDRAAVLDAVADITIYMADFFGKRHWDFGTIGHAPETGHVLLHDLYDIVGKLAHHQLKGEQGIRGYASEHDSALIRECARLLTLCSAACDLFDVNFPVLVCDIWNSKVAKRDWVNNPVNADDVAAEGLDATKR